MSGRRVAQARFSPRTLWLAALVVLALGLVLGAQRAHAAAIGISNVSADRYFSPNGDGQEDTYEGSYTLSDAATVTITVTNSGGSTVRTLQAPAARAAGGNTF